ncbi:uncharacterized protein ATNIH1004_000858 [Aspergillus tanneri]|uniref:Luciferase domain-containing protein n=1 Tax=Aspergillus tanneri TaxID=1220188 RepID=A0A5M9MYM7_9EURO|nr:uncharacterized protein ATNIH1004_000858 [Aspergillus tanneri]KAA8651958.1 hypothetical protein ATNIH1004_000858 [Aspergillus tanneri]
MQTSFNCDTGTTIPTTPFQFRVDVLCLLVILIPLTFHHVRKDYHAFLALGPGGTPPTLTGYLRICVLRILALRNPFIPPSLPHTLLPQTGYLHRSRLAQRIGPRPTIAGIAPQRQITQRSDKLIYQALTTGIHHLVNGNRDTLCAGTSCFEKHSTGIFCRRSTIAQQQQRSRITCDGEVCHTHPIDGSLHLTLHPADVKVILERGWGQRHPLAWADWWCWVRFVPSGFVMVYAPRDADELETVLEIIRAAAWWVSGAELQGSGEMEEGYSVHYEYSSIFRASRWTGVIER